MNTRRVKRIDELARDMPPARDLWPAIAQAIEADQAMSAASRTGPAPDLVARARRGGRAGAGRARRPDRHAVTPEVVVTTAATQNAPAE